MRIIKPCAALIMMLFFGLEWVSSGSTSASRFESRLDGSLLRALESDDLLAAAASSGYRIRDGRLHVVIVTDGAATDSLRQWLEGRGVSHVTGTQSMLQTFVDRETLSALEERPGVVWVRRPVYAEVPAEPVESAVKQFTLEVTTEGFAAMNGPAWRAAGFHGQGTKVGIIDIGFDNYQERTGGELPAADLVHIRAFGDSSLDSAGFHGTAMAEIVHDIAPAAELYLAIISTDLDVALAIDWMTEQNVQVVSMSLGWYFSGPGDGTGFGESLVEDHVVNHDVLWALPAGNHRDEHWQGTSVDQDGNGWIEFSNGQEILMLVGEDGSPEYFTSADEFPLRAYLRWNDWTAVDQDYRVCLFRVEGSFRFEAICSDETQNGGAGQQPCDYAYLQPIPSGYYGIGISRTGVSGLHDIDLHTPWTPRTTLEDWVGTSSLTDPGGSPHGVTTGAVDHRQLHEVCDFSAQGPVKGPGGTHEGGAMAPDVTAYSGISNSLGENRAAGTSAAVPHVAGAAALIRAARPDWSNLEVRRLIEHRAVDLDAPGWDNSAGAGRLHLGDPLPVSDQCIAIVSAGVGTIIADGDSDTVFVTVAEGCPWFAGTHSEWMHVAEGSQGSGNGSASYTVDPNPTCAPRQGILSIAGSQVVVTQEGRPPRTCPRLPSGRASPAGSARS